MRAFLVVVLLSMGSGGSLSAQTLTQPRGPTPAATGLRAPTGLGAPALRRPDDGSRQAVLRLLRSGVAPTTVRAYIEAHDLRFSLSADDVVELKRAGADDALLVFLLERSAPAGTPVSMDEGPIVYEADGVRAFKRKNAKGAEVLVITNLDENGVRLDTPPDVPEEPQVVTRDEPDEEPAPPPRLRSRRAYRPIEEEEEYFEPPPPSPRSAGLGYSPFYQFVPSNIPGPNSPWSPVYSIMPFYDAWNVWRIPTYPVSIVGLSPAYPLPYRRCRW